MEPWTSLRTSSQSRPSTKISTMSDNRSSVVNLSRPIALAPRTRCRSRAAWRASRRPGIGQQRRARRRGVQSRAQAYVFNVFGCLPKRCAADTYPCGASWPGPSWQCMSLDRNTQSTLNVARHAKKSEVEGKIETQIEYQEVQEG